MKIGIDISQLAYQETGVANHLLGIVDNLLKIDTKNEYVLFFSSFRKSFPSSCADLSFKKNVKIKHFRFPPFFLDLIWNRLHIMPIENFIGEIDIFISSDWTQPPTKRAKNVTVLYDLIVYKYPQETDKKIVDTQKRRLAWVKKESTLIICGSAATKNDAINLLGIDDARLRVIHPGV